MLKKSITSHNNSRNNKPQEQQQQQKQQLDPTTVSQSKQYPVLSDTICYNAINTTTRNLFTLLILNLRLPFKLFDSIDYLGNMSCTSHNRQAEVSHHFDSAFCQVVLVFKIHRVTKLMPFSSLKAVTNVFTS
ncbi:unnamed protein product [Ambrosiozyma monospora]|uniref:Unnamed protein product n=1 Tax=Ambrosiozyma monospora TaxID=43982 RepID=A0ACB5SV09_AMBMO|nr:unnamed protein product [Ambrosiozyma monospora]